MKMNNQIIENESAELCIVLAVQKGLRLGSQYIVGPRRLNVRRAT